MNKYIIEIIERISLANSLEAKSQAYLDLQGIIEIYTITNFSEYWDKDYLLMFSNSKYLDLKLSDFEFDFINNYLFYNAIAIKDVEEIYYNALCIKVLFRCSNVLAICNLIRLYYPLNIDSIISTLLSAICNMYADGSYLEIEDVKDILILLRDTELQSTKEKIDFIFKNYGKIV